MSSKELPPDMWFGSHGPLVLLLGSFLQGQEVMPKGYIPDGYFGDQMRRGVIVWQDKHGLTADGGWGPQTRAKAKSEYRFDLSATRDQFEEPTTFVQADGSEWPWCREMVDDPTDTSESEIDVDTLDDGSGRPGLLRVTRAILEASVRVTDEEVDGLVSELEAQAAAGDAPLSRHAQPDELTDRIAKIAFGMPGSTIEVSEREIDEVIAKLREQHTITALGEPALRHRVQEVLTAARTMSLGKEVPEEARAADGEAMLDHHMTKVHDGEPSVDPQADIPTLDEQEDPRFRAPKTQNAGITPYIPACHECGEIMIRNGSSYACVNCGATSESLNETEADDRS